MDIKPACPSGQLGTATWHGHHAGHRNLLRRNSCATGVKGWGSGYAPVFQVCRKCCITPEHAADADEGAGLAGLQSDVRDEHLAALGKRNMHRKPGGFSNAAIADPGFAYARAADAVAVLPSMPEIDLMI